MPAKSRAQARFMYGVANGSIKSSGMTPAQAKEYVSHNKGNMSYQNLPERLPRLRRMMRGGKV